MRAVILSFVFFPKPWSNNYGWGGLALALAIALDVRAHNMRGGPPLAAHSVAGTKDSDDFVTKDSDSEGVHDEGRALVQR